MEDIDLEQMVGHEPPHGRRSRVGLFVGIGCLAAVLVVGALGYLAYRGVKGVVSEFVEEYTDTEPRALPEFRVDQESARTLMDAVEEFQEAVRLGQPTEPLVLTGDEINQLIHVHPSWEGLRERVFISIEDDHVRGEVSFPLEEIGGFLAGRFLNGSAVFSVALQAGRLVVFVDSVEVNGEPLPDEFMNGIRAENLAEEFNQDPEAAALFRRLESISIRDDQVIIVPRR